MEAAIIAVGSELLGDQHAETDSLRLAAVLARFGIPVRRKEIVPDIEEEVAGSIRRCLEECALVLVTGGLGPTADDVTREGAAAALGRPLVPCAGVLRQIEARFSERGLKMPPGNRRQADLLEGAKVLLNERGTAPGQRIEEKERTLFLFPGVPSELEAMIAAHLEPWLSGRAMGTSLEAATVKVAWLPESEVDARLSPFYAAFGRRELTLLAAPGEVAVRIVVQGAPAERRNRLRKLRTKVEACLGDAVFGHGEETLEGVVGALLRRAGETLATAESCTGGLLSERLTRVAGSSAYFAGGIVAYSDQVKSELLGVPASLLERHGAVSREVAAAMAVGCAKALGTDLGIALTGIAGPGGGSEEKPVGTVYGALARADGLVTERRLRLGEDRQRVRWLASQWALESLRRELLANGS